MACAGLGAAAVSGMTGCAPQPAAKAAESAELASSGESDWLGSAPEIAEEEIAQTVETDLLIVGAGNAGMVAAATASDKGLDFVLCEKAEDVQQTRHWVGAVNTAWHKEANIKIDQGKLLNELTRYASGKCRQDVWNTWIRESADTVDFVDGIMKDAGMNIYLDTEGYDHETGGTDYFTPMIQHMWFDPKDAAEVPPCLAGEVTQKPRNVVLREFIEGKGNEIRFSHKLVKLEREEGSRVSGAVFETSDGYVRINAKKAVLLTTGGYAANPVMIHALAPEIPASCGGAYYSPNSMGEGIKAGLWAGAVMDKSSAPMIFDRAVMEPGVDAGYVGEGEGAMFPSPDAQIMLGSEPFMKVNREGKRFFNESAPYDWCTAAASKQPGGVWCSVFDSNAPADALRFSVVGCAKIGTALLQMGPIDQSFGQYLENGLLFKADTLEELAEALGLPSDEFVAEVERYNGFYDSQVDADFGKEAFRLSALRTPPYYGFWCSGALLTTLDGLQINADMQVLDEGRKVIEGLYAAGDCSGSLFSGNYPEYLVGCACGRSITEGRHAVLHIAEQ